MTDAQRQSLDVLNRLYAAETRSLLARVAQMSNFVPPASLAEFESVRRMSAEVREHQALLAEAIEQCGGGVLPAGVDVTTANLHYLTLSAIMPRVVADVEQLVRLYTDAAGAGSALMPQAARVINRIRRRHEANLGQLH